MAFNSADNGAFKNVWVICEQRQGEMMPTTFELISEGRKLADELGVELCGILLGIIEIFAKAFNTIIFDAVVFAVLIVVLLVKPSGLLGKYVPEKV